MNLRIAHSAEVDAITALINLAFQVEKFFIDGDRIDSVEVRSLFQKGWFLVMETEGVLCGCVYVEPRGSRAYLGLLSIHPAKQGTGMGARLVAAAEDHEVIQPLVKLVVLQKLAGGTLSGVDIGHYLLDLGECGLQVVGQRRVSEELACGALSAL